MEIADDSGKAIEVTLWGQVASSFPDMDASASEVVAFKGMYAPRGFDPRLLAVPRGFKRPSFRRCAADRAVLESRSCPGA